MPDKICGGEKTTAIANNNFRGPVVELKFSALPLRLRAFAVKDYSEFS